MIRVIVPGFFTTLQDEGRWGYQAYGLPISGYMDEYAGKMANLLVGNSAQAAVLEMTSTGGVFKFDEGCFVAVCGADMAVRLNGKNQRNWSSFWVPKQGEVSFGEATKGYRAYLAVQGGFHVPATLGSHSTCVKAGIGGHEGRSLQQGDVLYIEDSKKDTLRPCCVPAQYIPVYESEIQVRVLLGPQDELFSEEVIQLFFNSEYEVVDPTDRLGCSLVGPKILTGCRVDIISDAVFKGAIQVNPQGQPFIMMADHQTTGGFAKIGYIIHTDLPKVAQARPGHKLRFSLISEEEALLCLRERRKLYQNMQFNKIEEAY